MTFEALGSEEARVLEFPLYREEVLATLSGLCEDKAPRLDGFTMVV